MLYVQWANKFIISAFLSDMWKENPSTAPESLRDLSEKDKKKAPAILHKMREVSLRRTATAGNLQ
jgi:hypothetical protein